jgi:molybdate transport system substrate-binding protein
MKRWNGWMLRLAVWVSAMALPCMVAGCGGDDALQCYVGGTMRRAMEELAKDYEAKTGQKVHIDYGGSGELMARIQTTQTGDLYVAHDPFLAELMSKNLGVQGWTVAVVTPVIVVPKGNPQRITGFKDLGKPGLRVVLTHPQLSTAGWLIPVMAAKAGIQDAMRPSQDGGNVVTRTKGGGDAANQVMLGHADAAICWDAVAHLRTEKLDVVEIEPEYQPARDVDVMSTATFGDIDLDYVKVTVATLKFSKQLDAATKFAEFLASPEAEKVWLEFGFTPKDPTRSPASRAPARRGDSILVHCAAGMRPPIKRLAEEFEQASGTKVQLTYAGSNMLLGQIELSRTGDVYIAGDADYVDMAEEKKLVRSRKTICYFVPVIMVAKGNPKGVQTLADLTRDGMTIGQGDPKAAAIGRLMPRILELNAIDPAAWKANVKLQTPTVNELGMKMDLGTLDAVVVWDSIAAPYHKVADIVAIPAEKNICPVVEGAVLVTAQAPERAAAFLDFLNSERARSVLTESGYTVDPPATPAD